MLHSFFSGRFLSLAARANAGRVEPLSRRRRASSSRRPFAAEQLEGRLMLAAVAGATHQGEAVSRGSAHEAAMLMGGARSLVAPVHVAAEAKTDASCITSYTWQSIDQGASFTAQNWQRVAMSDEGRHQTAVTRGGNIYTSNDYGKSWQPCRQNLRSTGRASP